MEPTIAEDAETAADRDWPATLEAAPAEALIAWALRRWGDRVAVGTAFQTEGLVLLDMAWRIDRSVRLFTIDTGRLPPETHDFIEHVRERYDLAVEVYMPAAGRVEELVRRGGPNLFYRSHEERLACCHVRKVEPLRRALAGRAAWITGRRRDQGPTRRDVRRLERDPLHPGVIKLNPLADWSDEQVWAYVAAHDVPYHPLYDQGYRSIGCAPCTRASLPGEAPRAARWWWEQDGQPKECGLHWREGRPSPVPASC